MNRTIDMQLMRYINIFSRISHVSTSNCFVYNNTIYMAVPKSMMTKAIGPNGANVKEMSNVLRRKIRVVGLPSKEFLETADDNQKAKVLKEFITEIVSPVEITSFDFKDNSIFISGDRESKAILIGRDRSKEKQLAEILQTDFGIKEFKII